MKNLMLIVFAVICFAGCSKGGSDKNGPDPVQKTWIIGTWMRSEVSDTLFYTDGHSAVATNTPLSPIQLEFIDSTKVKESYVIPGLPNTFTMNYDLSKMTIDYEIMQDAQIRGKYNITRKSDTEFSVYSIWRPIRANETYTKVILTATYKKQ